MAERLTPERNEQDNHAPERAAELEALKQSPERVSEKKLSAERRAEKAAEKQSEEKIEKLSKSERKTKPELESEQAPEKPIEKRKFSKLQQRQAFTTELTEIQHQLRPSARQFSRIIHNPVVENVSQALEETIFRPSFLTGGAIGALVFGGLIYVVAYVQGFALAGSEFIFGLLIGGLVGMAVEFLVSIFRRGGKDQP